MRAQIEPHFLFNSLANVKRLCRTDAEAAITMLDNLVHYLRAALPRLRDAQSTLGQEAELVDAYLAVLKIRFGARLDYAIDVPAALRAHTFAPMMLLTLAENAIKHGITPSSRGGSIMIRAEAVDGCLVVRVSDSGVGFGAAPTDVTGVGLANSRARLAALFGDAAALVVSGYEPPGVVATITLPLATAGVRDAA
jgi:LytS/YehU family sensor histidine kinase